MTEQENEFLPGLRTFVFNIFAVMPQETSHKFFFFIFFYGKCY